MLIARKSSNLARSGSGYNNNCVGITSVLERSKLTNDCLKIVLGIFVGGALCGGALVAVPLWR